MEASGNSSFVSTERNKENVRENDLILEQAASTGSRFQSRLQDSESEPTTAPQQAEHDVQLDSLDDGDSYEGTARIHFNPLTRKIKIHGNLGRGAADGERPSNSEERRSMSRQNSAAPSPEAMGLLGAPYVTNNNNYFSNCYLPNSKFGCE